MDFEFKTIVLKDDQCLFIDRSLPSDEPSIVKNPHEIREGDSKFFRENKIWIHSRELYNLSLIFLNVFWEEGSYLLVVHSKYLKYIILTEDDLMIKDIIE